MKLDDFKHIHFIGIGGSGMSAIAQVLLERGFTVSGSDMADNAVTRRLAAAGAQIHRGHRAENIVGADLVVTSTAIRAENPERRAAESSGVTIWRRASVLAEIMHGGRSVAVSGTHGKTTTTSMLGLVMVLGGLDPTVLIGGELQDFGSNARVGRGEWVVAEADESDASFHEMHPDRIIMTNVEADHLDFYADLNAVIESFRTFIGNLRPGGRVVACLDDPGVRRVLDGLDVEVVGYGRQSADARMTVRDIGPRDGGRGMRFTPVWDGASLGEFTLGVPGVHNVLNALATIACGIDAGVEIESMRRTLAAYGGAKRRFQVKGSCGGITIVDDYAHHPTEIRATLAAARQEVEAGRAGRVVGLFQPHRYSRTQALAAEFGAALQGADLVVVTDVYPAGEPPIDGVSGRLVLDAVIGAGHRNAYYCPTLGEARSFFCDHLAEGDLLLTIGAGDVYSVGEQLIDDLNRRLTHAG